ncbi:MAG: transglutaminase domain-containing protein [Candidatus Omnitrophica bacterium]|nr:transglutaminase domain-containing protein [Candidatus Omnitrophota bacterium]
MFESHKGVDPFPSQREFKVSYETYIGAIPQDAKKLSVWIPLASSREGQIVKKREIITGLPYRITKDPVYGNEMAYFEVSDRVPQGLNFQVTYYAQTLQKNFASSNHETGVNRYLKPNHLMVVNDEVRKRTQQAIHGKRNLLEQARGIYENVINWMKYDKTIPGWGRGDTARACLLGKGNCTDFHSLFISMAHAAEIPARFKIGLTVPDGAEGEIPGYHCWAEFYEEGKGWQPVDASEAWKHPERKEVYFGNYDTNKFLISVGRDINLVPKQSGPPVNIFFYPYVEVDGKEWNGVKTSFQFKNLKTTGGEK